MQRALPWSPSRAGTTTSPPRTTQSQSARGSQSTATVPSGHPAREAKEGGLAETVAGTVMAAPSMMACRHCCYCCYYCCHAVAVAVAVATRVRVLGFGFRVQGLGFWV